MDVEIFARALQPISAARPCGAPLDQEQFRALRVLEREAWAEQLTDRRPHVAAAVSRWTQLASESARVLSTKSKHVEVAVQLVRSTSFLSGFEGSRQGVMFLADLTTKHWTDLHPSPTSEGHGSLWDFLTPGVGAPVVDTMPDLFQIWSLLPLTVAVDGNDPLSFLAFQRCQTQQDLRLWDEAVRATPRNFYEGLRAQIEGANNAYARLGALLNKRAKTAPGGMDRERADFAKAQALLRTYLDLIGGAIVAAGPERADVERDVPDVSAVDPLPDGLRSVEPIRLWDDGLRASLDGARRDWPKGLREVALQAAAERTGRELFLLKLDIARLFIEKRRHDLAGVLLQGLNVETAERGLLQWEGRAFVAEMKALLRQCRTREGKQDEALKLQEELCHLAPWLAADA